MKCPMHVFVVSLAIILGADLIKPTHVFAQNKAETFTAKQSIYLELGGSSGRYAVNYSRIFYQKGKLKLNASAGFSMWSNTLNSKTTWLPVVPLELSSFYGRSNHHLELGIGLTSFLDRTLEFDSQTLATNDNVVFGAIIPVRIGYRYQKPEGGFFFRVGYTPFFSVPVGGREEWNFDPRFAGLSFGKSF